VVLKNCGDAWWKVKVRRGWSGNFCPCESAVWGAVGIDSPRLQVQCLTMKQCVSNCDTIRSVEPPAKSCATDMAARGFGEFSEKGVGQGGVWRGRRMCLFST
jgi:hypothetical protein